MPSSSLHPRATNDDQIASVHDHFFSITRWSKSPELRKMINYILDQAKEHDAGVIDEKERLLGKREPLEKMRVHLNVLLCNLFEAHTKGAELVINRNHMHYKAPKELQRYNAARIGADTLFNAVRILEQVFDLQKRPFVMGEAPSRKRLFEPDPEGAYIADESATTPQLRKTSTGRCTTYWLPRQFADNVIAMFGFDPDSIDSHPNMEVIELKHSKETIQQNKAEDKHRGAERLTGLRRYKEYEEADLPPDMRPKLEAYNALIAKTCICLHLPSGEVKRVPSGKAKRVFVDSFDTGGRYYGPKWQNIPSRLRQYITLDGQPTRELDFKALHISMLYHRAGLELDLSQTDPYSLYRFKHHQKEKDLFRNLTKDGCQMLINCPSFEEALKALKRKLCKPKNADRYPSDPKKVQGRLKEILGDLVKEHPLIADQFYSSQWGCLQNIDSQIAEFVMHRFTTLKKRILCYHDGFRVVEGDVQLAHDLMIQAYQTILKTTATPYITVKE